MRAVSCHRGELTVVDLPDPRPERGQILLEVTRAGICGSDLHARHHADEVADGVAQLGYPHLMRSDQHVVMGHEFTGTILEYGAGTRKKWPIGTPVVALPMLRTSEGVQLTGLTTKAPGAYAERVLVSEALTLPVPDHVSPTLAALTEPLAVARHAVRRGEVGKRDVALVIGCGPIGLAVILMLKAQGVRTVVASDFSPARRALATACGADLVVDPAAESPWEAYGGRRTHFTTAPALFDFALDSTQRLRRVPGLPWWRVMALADRLGQAPRGPVVFECVGVPGMIDQVVAAAPMRSRIVVVGVCMGPDTIRPTMAINKEAELRFVFAYDPAEFRDTLQLVADGKIDPSPLVTGTVGLAGVAAAFEVLGDPEQHAKILVDPTSDVSVPPPARVPRTS